VTSQLKGDEAQRMVHSYHKEKLFVTNEKASSDGSSYTLPVLFHDLSFALHNIIITVSVTREGIPKLWPAHKQFKCDTAAKDRSDELKATVHFAPVESPD
jgi:hypothetical protein